MLITHLINSNGLKAQKECLSQQNRFIEEDSDQSISKRKNDRQMTFTKWHKLFCENLANIHS
jgi:hypothetical protein